MSDLVWQFVQIVAGLLMIYGAVALVTDVRDWRRTRAEIGKRTEGAERAEPLERTELMERSRRPNHDG